MVFDELGKDKERERKEQEFLNDLLLNAAAEGLTYTDLEIQEILADSERLCACCSLRVWESGIFWIWWLSGLCHPVVG